MPKHEVTSDAIRKPIGIFSQATVTEAKGRLALQLHFSSEVCGACLGLMSTAPQ